MMADFRLWMHNRRHPTVASANAASSSTTANPIWRQARQVGTATTTTTAPKVVSNEEVASNVNVVTKKDANSILNGIAAAAAAVVDNDETATTPTVPKISLNEKEIAPKIHAEIASNEICMRVCVIKNNRE